MLVEGPPCPAPLLFSQHPNSLVAYEHLGSDSCPACPSLLHAHDSKFSLRPKRFRVPPLASLSAQLSINEAGLSEMMVSTERSARQHSSRNPGIRPWPDLHAVSSQLQGVNSMQAGFSSDDSAEEVDEDEDEEISGQGSGSGTGKGSGEAEPSESDGAEDLRRIKCGICRKALIQPTPSSRVDPADIRICDGCHCGYHSRCARRKAVGSTVKQPGGRLTSRRFWYCSSGCQASHQKLLSQCAQGMQPVPDSVAGSLSQHLSKLEPDSTSQGQVFQWALVDCAEAERRHQSAQGERMDEVVLLLSQQHGPFVMRQAEGSDFGVLLRQGEVPLGAAMMDCFGQDACAVDFMASAERLRHVEDEPEMAAARELDAILGADERGIRGHQLSSSSLMPRGSVTKPLDQGVACALVGCLEDYLGPTKAASRLLGIVDDPLSVEGGQAMDLWKQLGYRRMTNRQVHQLQDSYPLLAANGDRAVYFAKSLQGRAAAAPAVDTTQGQQDIEGGSAGKARSGGKEGEGGHGLHRRPKRFFLTARLWGWAARQLLHKATLGMV
ncbi:hypothetical protein DUNSADRAFT_6958 [Dunaliella salina]|uniref:Zinc finger PHD-type domain-containing protein n=1 Tax=Dunaliella salina TaxID=3046 RepID=A0ABQ7GMB9_DUNSA|nr:hypothetical protein DUNSADRAFT_6958 [Dunaliella salina]|eukprot:KAF5835732.1 hypothetical protein DUNSADRAFT_6958 [Dunaliella salina]